MKTAIEWMESADYPKQGEKTVLLDEKEIKQIQSDVIYHCTMAIMQDLTAKVDIYQTISSLREIANTLRDSK